MMMVNKRLRIASWSMYLYSFFALISAISMGMVIGWSSIALNSMQMNSSSVPKLRPQENPIDSSYMTWIGSSITLGALVGCLFGGMFIFFSPISTFVD